MQHSVVHRAMVSVHAPEIPASVQMGVIEEDDSMLDPKALGQLCGPVVHLMGTDPRGAIWHGTVLIAVHSNLIPPQGLQLTFASGHTQPTDVAGAVLYSQQFGGAQWSVVRYAVLVCFARLFLVMSQKVCFVLKSSSNAAWPSFLVCC